MELLWNYILKTRKQNYTGKVNCIHFKHVKAIVSIVLGTSASYVGRIHGIAARKGRGKAKTEGKFHVEQGLKRQHRWVII